MRILVNHSNEDILYRQNLMFLMKEVGLSGVATAKTYDITSIQATAKGANCEAVLLTNPNTLSQLLGEKATLDRYRGTRINYNIPIIVANPLDHIHTVTYGKWLLKRDLLKFRRIKEPVQHFDFIVVNTQETRAQAYQFLKNCLLISFDIESDSAPQMTCISFTALHVNGTVRVFVVPIVDFDHVHYESKEELAETLLFLRAVCALQVTKVAFNGIYDSQYMILYDMFPELYLIDVMQLGWSEYSELPRALEFQASLHCYDYFFWKDESDRAKKTKDIRGYWAYCGKDSWYTLRCLLSMLTDLKDYQVFNYNETFRQTFPTLYTAYQGMLINAEQKKKGKEEAQAKLDKLLDNLRKMSANPTFNPGSWQQVSQLVYDVIGAKKIQGKESPTNAKTLNRVSMQHPLLARICGDVIKAREEKKAISTYYEVEEKNGRLLFNLDPTGAETGRYACKASSFWVGTQIQNIPPYAKRFLWADDGYTLIEADKNKSEARCVAYASNCEPLIKALEDLDKDFYKVVSELFFGIPWDQVTDEMRNDVTKHIIHGTHHCMGPEPFIDTATPQTVFKSMKLVGWKGRDMKDFVKYLLSLYHKNFQDVRKYWKDDILNVIAVTGKTVSPIGWTRYFFGDPHKNHKVFRGAVAHQSQNLSVHLINREFWWIWQELVVPSRGEFKLVAQIHDSILAQAKNEKAEYYAKEMHKIMTRSETIVHGRKMLLPVDVKISAPNGSWGAYDEKEFPLGMRKVKLV